MWKGFHVKLRDKVKIILACLMLITPCFVGVKATTTEETSQTMIQSCFFMDTGKAQGIGTSLGVGLKETGGQTRLITFQDMQEIFVILLIPLMK